MGKDRHARLALEVERATHAAREAEGRRKMARTQKWKYAHDPMGDLDELYDLGSDPWELHNVAADPAYQDVVAEMGLRLMDWSIQTEDGRPVPLP